MKTLDTLEEVIDYLEKVTLPMTFEAVKADALHYLKEHKEMKEHLACMDSGEIRGDATQIVDNPALTWNELRQMEGKPVWVECEKKGRWNIIREVTDTHVIFEIGLAYHKCWQGDLWQAYRKERE